MTKEFRYFSYLKLDSSVVTLCTKTDGKWKDRQNGFKNGKTQLFNSRGVVKWAYFQKKWSVPLKEPYFLSVKIVLINQRTFIYYNESFVEWNDSMDVKDS